MASQPLPTKLSDAADAYLSLSTEKTFESEGKLPALPLPSLEKTLERYLYWARPHLSPEEYAHTVKVVNEFESGIGKELHKKLQSRAEALKNWVEIWWLQYAYLTVREPILPMMNTTGPLPLNLSIWEPSIEHALEGIPQWINRLHIALYHLSSSITPHTFRFPHTTSINLLFGSPLSLLPNSSISKVNPHPTTGYAKTISVFPLSPWPEVMYESVSIPLQLYKNPWTKCRQYIPHLEIKSLSLLKPAKVLAGQSCEDMNFYSQPVLIFLNRIL
ncbi:hypothetical protein SK128_027303 [Halocaridina rubra]|uniref:Choline/carnitine acyltransferase domain-containing protein n=1 Tax=Halocaridina rubra TaxID=373956 RepID=A0AAN9AEY0_HALRR